MRCPKCGGYKMYVDSDGCDCDDCGFSAPVCPKCKSLLWDNKVGFWACQDCGHFKLEEK